MDQFVNDTSLTNSTEAIFQSPTDERSILGNEHTDNPKGNSSSDKTWGEILYPNLPKDASDKTESAPGQPPANPASSEYSFQIPEGLTLDPEAANATQQILSELKATPDHAQRLVDLHTEGVRKAIEAELEETSNEFSSMRTEWQEESKRILGRESETQLRYARNAMQQYGTPELRRLLNESAIGDHPAMLRFMISVGRGLLNQGGAPSSLMSGNSMPRRQSNKTAAEILYPNMKHA